MEGIVVIFIFFGVIAVTALVFGVWLFAAVARLLFRGVGMILSPGSGSRMPVLSRGKVCHNTYCRAVNPGTAQFCRRCGQQLPGAQQVTTRRAAMW